MLNRFPTDLAEAVPPGSVWAVSQSISLHLGEGVWLTAWGTIIYSLSSCNFAAGKVTASLLKPRML